jgi:hypothetical protein
MTMTLIETKTLGASAAAIEFTSIPQDGTDLVMLVSLRGVASGDSDRFGVRFNGDTATNYSNRYLIGDGSAASSSNRTSQTSLSIEGGIQFSSTTSNTFGNAIVYIPNYTVSVAKSISADAVTENNATSSSQAIVAGLWNNTAAISSILVNYFNVSDLAAGSTVSLYKITKGSDGIVTTS